MRSILNNFMDKKKNLKIVHLTNIPTPYRINFFNELNTIFKKQNIDLFIIYCARSEPNRNWEIKKSDFKFKFKVIKGITINIFGIYFHLNPFILNYLNKLDPDLLINAGSWNMPSALLSLLIFNNNKKCIKLFWSEGHKNSVRHPTGLVAIIRRFILKKYKYFLVPNKISQDFLLKDSKIEKNKTILLPNTIQERIFQQKYEFPNSKFRVLTIVASLEKRKGFIYFLKALEEIEKNLKPNLKIEIIGYGPLHDLIKKSLYKSDISYTMRGNLNPKEISYIFSKSHGFILPSIIDPNPLSAIEALASGLPLLLSNNCGNVNECVLENQNGWTFNPKDPKEIKNKIEIWLSKSIKELYEMKAISRNRYSKYFAIKNICENVSNELYKIASLNNFVN